MACKKELKAFGLLLILTSMVFSSLLLANTYLDEDFRKSIVDTSVVLTKAEVMPEIEGGIEELYNKIEYPHAASINNVEGYVFVRFIVDENGNVHQPEILKDIGAGCGDAVIKGIKKMRFTPGKQDGEPVSVYFILPVTFKLES